MSMWINEDCINCGACEPECPNTAIAQGDPVFVIDVDKCTECVGAFDTPKCIETCPVEDCIIVDPNHTETREQLEAKFASLH